MTIHHASLGVQNPGRENVSFGVDDKRDPWLRRAMRVALLITSIMALPAAALFAQLKPAEPPKVEPGLESAVLWKWRVLPSEEADWGLPLAAQVPDPAKPTASGSATPGPRPNTYEVKKGDALILIARKFGMTADQLKQFNGLTTDTIRIGQVLKIPTVEELVAMAPPAPPKKEEPKPAESTPKTAAPDGVVNARIHEDLLLQVFLDREQFSTGPIDGNPGPMFSAVSQRYRETRGDVQDIHAFAEKARKAVGHPITRYALRAEDFRFIAAPAGGAGPAGRKSSKSKARTELPPPTYQELASARVLTYRSAWEFIAERFHCDEAFLRSLNPRIKGSPAAGTIFQVPNVIPFEIEKLVESPLQPAADPQKAMTATLVELARLEIYEGEKLVAVMPTALARPDLRGRGSWTILDAIPRPKLATLQELKEEPKPADSVDGTAPIASPKATLATEQFLAAGPNNPVGVVWINLAKAKSTEALPYGLHGTSIPGRMKTQAGIGGIRLANWDIARAVRLLPPGTALQWK